MSGAASHPWIAQADGRELGRLPDRLAAQLVVDGQGAVRRPTVEHAETGERWERSVGRWWQTRSGVRDPGEIARAAARRAAALGAAKPHLSPSASASPTREARGDTPTKQPVELDEDQGFPKRSEDR